MIADHLVVDSSAFIHHGPVRETGKNIYSCSEVIDEIKDKATRESLQILPYELKLLQPDRDDINECIAFSKRTGDYHQLSVPDLKLIASTYTLEKRYNSMKFINKDPKQVSVKPLASNPNSTRIKDILNTRLSDDEDEINDEEDGINVAEGESEEGEEEEEEVEDDNESQWITPTNVKRIVEKMGYDRQASTTAEPWTLDRVIVACMSSDFSIQNCLLQMGLLVVSPVDGLMIKEAKKIALRCHACLKVFHDLSKIKNKFCPQCGNLDTLKRVQYIIDKDGSKRVLINFRRPIKVKGTNQQLPRPRGGKHANNPVLTADQRVRKDKQEKFVVNEKKTVTADHILHDPAYLVRTNPFVYRSEGRKKK